LFECFIKLSYYYASHHSKLIVWKEKEITWIIVNSN